MRETASAAGRPRPVRPWHVRTTGLLWSLSTQAIRIPPARRFRNRQPRRPWCRSGFLPPLPGSPPHIADPVTIISDFAGLVTTFAPVSWQMSHRRASKDTEYGHRAGNVRVARHGWRHRPVMRVHNPACYGPRSRVPFQLFVLRGKRCLDALDLRLKLALVPGPDVRLQHE